MGKTDARSGIKYGWQFGENNWNAEMDANLVRLGRIGFHLSARAVAAVPTATPESGHTYIVAAGAGGVFAGQDGKVAVYHNGQWDFKQPGQGWLCFVESTGKLMAYSGSTWSALLEASGGGRDPGGGDGPSGDPDVDPGGGSDPIVDPGWEWPPAEEEVDYYALAATGQRYYVDPSAIGSSNEGTIQNPFNSFAAIANKSFGASDCLFFKAGTTLKATAGTDRVIINWGGTAAKPAVIGAYHGDGTLGLGGLAMPKLDGDMIATSTESGFVRTIAGKEHICIQDLDVGYANWYGIGVASDHTIVKNCYVHHCTSHCIVIGRCGYSRVTRCHAYFAGYLKGPRGSVGLIICSSTDNFGASHHNRIDHCTGSDGHAEGFGLYLGVSDSIIENNIVWNCRNVNYYLESKSSRAGRNIVRNNISFSNDRGFVLDGTRTAWGISCNLEHMRCIQYPEKYNNNLGMGPIMYGNVVFGTRRGIIFDGEDPNLGCDIGGIRYVRAFNNTCVDNDSNFTFSNFRQGWEGHYVKNNISAVFDAASSHTNNMSPSNVQFDNNLYNTAVTGNANTGAITANPQLKRSASWRNIDAANVGFNFDYHEITGSSPAVNQAKHLTTINTTKTTASVDMVVDDVFWFAPGMFIAVDSNNDGTIDWVDEVVSFDPPEVQSDLVGTVKLKGTHTYTEGGKIYLSRSSTLPFIGAGPDIGAHEYDPS